MQGAHKYFILAIAENINEYEKLLKKKKKVMKKNH